MAIIYKCDRCGNGYYLPDSIMRVKTHYKDDNGIKHEYECDLCRYCLDDLQTFFETTVKREDG